ncbi:MAG TPA: ABC transporter permease [Candidatus Stackebrandtia faecavium]|nr:ABC transporter permease [Candidatus Stackebrandtia faecavium]
MKHWCRSYIFLLKWEILRSKRELPFFLILQAMISLGVVIGFSFLLPHATAQEALYLCTGSMTVSLITVGMVLAPQAVAKRKESGFLDYQRSMPVPRLALMAADATVWAAVSVPGLIVTTIVALTRFELDVATSPLIIPTVVMVIAGTISVGYSLAYLVRPAMVNILTNSIIVIALMFAPINFPASRLPDWLASVHNVLPFQYMAQAIRETIDVPASGVPMLPFVVLGAWCIVGLAIASRALTHRS